MSKRAEGQGTCRLSVPRAKTGGATSRRGDMREREATFEIGRAHARKEHLEDVMASSKRHKSRSAAQGPAERTRIWCGVRLHQNDDLGAVRGGSPSRNEERGRPPPARNVVAAVLRAD